MRAMKLLLLSVLAAPAAHAAAPQPLDALLDTMSRTDGADYLAARARLASLPAAEKRALEQRLQAPLLAHRPWGERARLQIAALWARSPERAAQALAVAGVEPGRYLRKRRPEPSAEAELLRWPAELRPLYFELLLEPAVGAARPADQYPAGADVARLRGLEQAALQQAALLALSRSADADALEVLRAVAEGRSPCPFRALAAQRLGESRAPAAAAMLRPLAEGSGTADEVVAGALAGLAALHGAEGLAVMRTLAGSERPLVRGAALSSLGALAGRWSTRRMPAADRHALAAAAAQILAARLAHSSDAREETLIIEALSRIGGAEAEQALAAERTAARDEAAARYQRAAQRLARAL